MQGSVDFGTVDGKGRALGALWYVYAQKATPARATSWGGYPAQEAGFRVQVQPSRNGKRFGAIVQSVLVTDLDAAFAEVARRASGTMKRYAKLASKAVAS